MLKKELLLCGGGKVATHTLTVGKDEASTGSLSSKYYGMSSASTLPFGSITPQTFNNKQIFLLNSRIANSDGSEYTQMGFGANGNDEVSGVTNIKITRLDTMASVILNCEKQTNFGMTFVIYEANGLLFNSNDAGKSIGLIIEAV